MADNIGKIEESVKSIKEGTATLMGVNKESAAAVVVTKNEVRIIGGESSFNGINVSPYGVVVSGDVMFISSGKNIKKGQYSENPKGYKVYTYPETVWFESKAKEEVYKKAGEVAGVNLATSDPNIGMPIITDIAAGPVPHVHTISIKHVHRVEPAYLYRIPDYVLMFKGFIGRFRDFLSA